MQSEPSTAAAGHPANRAQGWLRWLPGLVMLKGYQLSWLPKDVAAGLVLTTMPVPVGIAYAQASGVPGVVGLYATIVPLLAYALFGPSRILVVAPDSALAAPILAVVVTLAMGDPSRAIAVASTLAIVSGVFCIVMGLLRLRFITELLSKPIRYGYMNGIAITVLISQLPRLFGVSGNGDGSLGILSNLTHAIVAGKTSWYSLVVGAGCLALILLLKRFDKLPGILIAVVLATLCVSRGFCCFAGTRRHFHPTVGSAIDDYLKESGATTLEHGTGPQRP
ncbi:sulfate permease family protein [Paraburkholderia sp. RAU2J]|nr:sulfate permease family protein [Paraburkholderia sp. RAU2J]